MQLLIEIPYVLIQSVVYGLIVYAMMGFPWVVKKVFWNLYVIFTLLMIQVLFGMMMIGLTPNVTLAGIISSFFYTVWNLFSGFIIPHPVSNLRHAMPCNSIMKLVKLNVSVSV